MGRQAYGWGLSGSAVEAADTAWLPDRLPDAVVHGELRIVNAADGGSIAAPDDADVIGFRDGGRAWLLGDTITVSRLHPTEPDALPHPMVTTAVGLVARRAGFLHLHAGALVVEGRAWGVVGTREAGKSTLVATAAMLDVPVLSDDALFVTPVGTVDVGPRCVDLRAPAADALASEVTLVPVRGGERHRMTLPALTGQFPLAGLVVLDVADRWNIEAVPPSARLRAVQGCTDLTYAPSLGLALVTLPVLRFSRPLDHARRADDVSALVAALRNA